MATSSKKLIQNSRHLLSRLSLNHSSHGGILVAAAPTTHHFQHRILAPSFSSSSGGGKSGNGDEEDLFGLNDNIEGNNASDTRLGKDFPPHYLRDKTTGKLTGQIEIEPSLRDKQLLSMTPVEQERKIVERLVQKWKTSTEDDHNKNLESLGERVGEEDMALNTFGRSRNQKVTNQELSSPLTQDEFKSFSKFMKKEHDVHVSKDDIPVLPPSLDKSVDLVSKSIKEENPDLDLAYLYGSRDVLDGLDSAGGGDTSFADDPFSELQPSDFSPVRLVNRKKAKYIPPELIHHNNLSILRRYTTPTGEIMNRVQSRLSAKDQRKIAKMIKRARALGLVPYKGQWKYENHGNIYEKDIHKSREWEMELEQRGLVIQKGGSGAAAAKQGNKK